MRVIYKYPIKVTDEFHHYIPEGAEFLTVDVQHGDPVMWFKCDPDAQSVNRTFHVAGTGHPITDEWTHYLGTFMLHGGAFVGHLFSDTGDTDDTVSDTQMVNELENSEK